MKDEHVLDDLSAYCDGEAPNSDDITRHLQFCELCARRYMELLKLSAHLRSMPQPEVRPEFVSQVLARIFEEGAYQPAPRIWQIWRRRTWRLPWQNVTWGFPQAAMVVLAAIVVIVAVVSWRSTRPVTTPSHVATPSVLPSEEALITALNRLAEQGTDLSALIETEGDEELYETEVPFEEMLDWLADASAQKMSWDELAYDGDTVDGIVEGLNQDEAAAFYEVLREYKDALMKQGNTGEQTSIFLPQNKRILQICDTDFLHC